MSEEGAIVKALQATAAPLLKQGSPMVEGAAAFIVSDGASYARAGEMALGIKRVGDAIYKLFDDPCKDANALHKKLTGLRGKMHGPFKMSYDLLMRKAGNWKSEDDARVRREQEAVERKAREAEAEQARKAEELRQANMPEAAEAMIAAEPPAPVPVIRSNVPKVKGISPGKGWRYEVVDETKVKRSFLQLNESAIKGLVDRIGMLAEEQVGGIKVFEKTTMAGRTG